MSEREKVIEGLGHISEWLFPQYRVAYDGDAPNYYDAYKTVDEAIELLKEQEAVVRCKDCRYSNLYCVEDTNGEWLYECCHPSDDNSVIRKWNWFCADGERR